MGWPLEWPSSPKSGHFVLEDAVWLAEDNGEPRNIELINVEKIMLDTTTVTMVEFMKQMEAKNES
jgi:hypothetical protein